MAKIRISDDVMEFFPKTGSVGGKTRAKKHSKEQLREMGEVGWATQGER